jgi:hypothetical protein
VSIAIDRCSVCNGELKQRLELWRKCCWVCFRLKQSVAKESAEMHKAYGDA